MREIAILPTVYTEDEVARQLGVHQETLARERRARRIAYTSVGGKIRYKPEHIEAYLRDRECATTSRPAAASGTSTATIQPLDASAAHRLACEIAASPTKPSHARSSPVTSRSETPAT